MNKQHDDLMQVMAYSTAMLNQITSRPWNPPLLVWHPKTGMTTDTAKVPDAPLRGTYSRLNGVWRIFTRHTNGKKIGWQHIPPHHIPKKLRADALLLGVKL